jgi:hypothetical protein
MQTTTKKAEAGPVRGKPANAEPHDIASASIPDALAALKVNPETGLTRAEVDTRRKEHDYNEWRVLNAVAEKPVEVTPQIANRAYDLYEQRGRQDGRAVEDWEQAEREIREDEPHK